MTEATAIADDVLYEVIEGQIVEKPASGGFQSWVAAVLAQAMHDSGAVNPFGLVVFQSLFHLDPSRNQKRRPDLAFVSFERWPANRPVPDEESWAVVPELAVEIISKTYVAKEVVTKLNEYFKAGVQLVWIIYPAERMLYVYTSPTAVRILQDGDELDGEPVFTGFRVPVRKVFGDRD